MERPLPALRVLYEIREHAREVVIVRSAYPVDIALSDHRRYAAHAGILNWTAGLSMFIQVNLKSDFL
jgi:hypothetical protein